MKRGDEGWEIRDDSANLTPESLDFPLFQGAIMVRPGLLLAAWLVLAGSVHADAFKLDLPSGATAALAGFMINANSIGKATLTGTYSRKQ
ncbi:MAG: hypothetical protein IPK39_08135 [Sulfuritalea sp.]|nr:hypothetical protein [Sulfuritalea sp.]